MNEQHYEKLGLFYLGRALNSPEQPLLYDSRNLLTHAICVGMTGSGKTGLCVDLLEEAAIDGIPCIAIDPKGDIGNLALTFSGLSGAEFEPWVDAEEARRKGMTTTEFAAAQADKWREGLAVWGQGAERIERLRKACEVTIYTPGANAGRMISLLSSFAAPSAAVRAQADVMADRIESTVSGLLGLLGIQADPLQSPEHVFMSNVIGFFWNNGQDLDFVGLIRAIQRPPFERIGIMDVDDVFGPKDRAGLAMRLNTLLASPSFAPWMEGDALDVDRLLYTPEGKARISVFSISHLSDSERMFFVTLLLDRVLGWMRGQPGTTSLRALLYMDEVFGYLPPVAEPPSKKPLLTMLKQARAHGLGLVLATQNPADLDYKALSNAGTWFLGRLQTERDVNRVVDGLKAAGDFDQAALSQQLSQLKSRRFLMHSVHQAAPVEFETRWALSFLKGPLTRDDIKRLSPSAKAAGTGFRATPAAPAPVTPVASSPTPNSPASLEPMLPDALDAYYLPMRVPAPEGTSVLYRPMCYADASVHLDQPELGSQGVACHRIAAFGAPPMLVDWERASDVTFDMRVLQTEGQPGAQFMEVPRDVRDPKVFKTLQKNLEELLSRTAIVETLECKSLKLKSQPGEEPAKFHERVSQEIRTRRDAELDKIRQKFQARIEREQDQVARAQERVDRERAEARHAQMDSALSVGTSILGAFMGRSVVSAVRNSASSASRSSRAQADIGRAEDALAREMEDVTKLGEELERELEASARKFDPANFPVESKPVFPKKQDIQIRFCGLVFVPYYVDGQGRKMRAF